MKLGYIYYPQSYYVYQNQASSDHSPFWLHINSASTKGFCYSMKCPGFDRVLQQAWHSTPSCTPQFQFVSKLKALKQALKACCKSCNINTDKRIKALREKLNHNNDQQLSNPFSEELLKEEQQLKLELHKWLDFEEEQLRQKAGKYGFNQVTGIQSSSTLPSKVDKFYQSPIY